MTISSVKANLWNRALLKIGETVEIQDEDDDTPAAQICSLLHDDLARELFEVHAWPWAVRHAALSTVDTEVVTYAGNSAETDFTIGAAYRDANQVTVVRIGQFTVGIREDMVLGTDYTLSDDGTYVSMTVAVGTGASLEITVTNEVNGWEHLFSAPTDLVTALAVVPEDTRYTALPAASRTNFDLVPNNDGTGFWIACDDETAIIEYVAEISHIRAWPRLFSEAFICRMAAELALSIKKSRPDYERLMGDCLMALDRAIVAAENQSRDMTEPTTPGMAARG